MKKTVIILLGLMLLSGCAKLSRLDQLLTLKNLAEEQDQLNQYVERQDQNFELMLEKVKAGTLSQYMNKRKILRTFGEPIYIRNVTEDDQVLESWLYRYATEFFDVEKIYLYFDREGNLVKSEYIKGKNGESGKETSPEDGYKEI